MEKKVLRSIIVENSKPKQIGDVKIIRRGESRVRFYTRIKNFGCRLNGNRKREKVEHTRDANGIRLIESIETLFSITADNFFLRAI